MTVSRVGRATPSDTSEQICEDKGYKSNFVGHSEVVNFTAGDLKIGCVIINTATL